MVGDDDVHVELLDISEASNCISINQR